MAVKIGQQQSAQGALFVSGGMHAGNEFLPPVRTQVEEIRS
jgi:hypothetical protein